MNDWVQRKPLRLSGYDYRKPGYYFVTICTHKRGQNILAEIPCDSAVGAAALGGPPSSLDDIFGNPLPVSPTLSYRPVINLTDTGKIVEQHIQNIDHVYCGRACVDCYVIMPDHVHLIVWLQNLGDGPPRAAAPTVSLSEIINALKGLSTKKIGYPIWQRGYYEHIIRRGSDLQNIRQYIQSNPLKWISDKE